MKGNIRGLQREVNTKEMKSLAILYFRHQRLKRCWSREGVVGPPLRERYQIQS